MKCRKLLNGFLFSFFFLFTTNLSANCNFNIIDFKKEIKDISNIKKVEIKVLKYRNWKLNAIKSIRDNDRILKKYHKKRFNSKFIVHYNFGECEFKSRIRLHGDKKKEHFSLVGGKIRTSIDVDLIDGNFLSSVKFKLLIPESRMGTNEIFATILLKKLGFISPNTFFTNLKLNDEEYKVIFQKKAGKEMLENNNRVEGPIFEGDEAILWLNNNDLNNFFHFELEKFSASRLVNANWASKGVNSILITLEAFSKLQNTYFFSVTKGVNYFINPNNNDIFFKYDLLLMSMNGFHGLRPHNRKFYFNIQNQYFEPIYYDGDININKKDYIKLYSGKLFNNIDYFLYNQNLKDSVFKEINLALEELNISELIEEYKKKTGLTQKKSEEDINFFLNSMKKNLVEIKDEISSKSMLMKLNDNWKEEMIKLQKNTDFKQNYISVYAFNNDENLFSIKCEINLDGCENKMISTEDILNIMENNILNEYRTVIINVNSLIPKDSITTANLFNDEKIIHSSTGKVEFNKEKREIHLIQNFSDDWFLFKNQKLENLTIKLFGVKNKKKYKMNFQKINPIGLTGCLTFYKTDFKKTNISSKDGECEDSLNLIFSTGELENLSVVNSHSDGVDLDFSEIKIDNVFISNAYNDCMDFSFGIYYIKNLYIINCGDKGISVGEQSKLNINKSKIENVNIGIASKDDSDVNVSELELNTVKTCLSAYNKKQEFNGGYIFVKNLKCKNYYKFFDKDLNSKILVNKKVL